DNLTADWKRHKQSRLRQEVGPVDNQCRRAARLQATKRQVLHCGSSAGRHDAEAEPSRRESQSAEETKRGESPEWSLTHERRSPWWRPCRGGISLFNTRKQAEVSMTRRL